MVWIYKEKEINTLEDLYECQEEIFGFVYEITHKPTGRKYLGRKQLLANRTLPPLKDSKKRRKVVQESNWKAYWGSNSEFKDFRLTLDPSEFTREILVLARSRKLLTYYENKYLFSRGVIEPGSLYFNDNVEGRYFKRDF